MKKWGLIAGGVAAALLLAVVVYKLTRPAPPPAAKVVEAPKGPDPAHLAKIKALVSRIEELEGLGRFNDALNVLKELAALEPGDSRLADFRSRLTEKKTKLEAWLAGLQRAESDRADALRRNTPADWQKAADAAAAAEKLAMNDEQRTKARTLGASARQHQDWGLAREEEKKGKLDAAIELAARAIGLTEPPPELTAYKAGLEKKKRKADFDRAAYAARAEGNPPKAYELWQKARPLAEDPKDVAEADGRLHDLKPWVDPAERDRRYDEALKAGDAALAAGELDASEKAYTEARRLKVTEVKPSQGLARVSAARGTKAVDLHLAAAKEAEAKKEWADAIDAYERALRVKPDDAAAAARRKSLIDTHRPPTISLKISESTGVKMDFVLVKRGTFQMGDARGGSDEAPREAAVAKDFWMQATETTQAQWQVVMGTTPWLSSSVPLLPVEGVSWDDAQKFLEKLNALLKDALQGRRAALPTETEWEYACRAGSKTRWSFGDNESAFDLHGWQAAPTIKSPQPVAKKQANAWGLFDMYGNVAEWCVDEAGKAADDAPALRAVRGGSWNDKAANCRSSKRDKAAPGTSNAFLGFRVILRPPAN